MKTCRRCAESKLESEYYARYATCKVCILEKQKARGAEYYKENAKKICDRTNANYHANPERYLQHKQNWRKANPEPEKATRKAYRASNIDQSRATEAYNSSFRRGQQRRATPSWIDKAKVLEMYKYAQKHGLHVDHIVPLLSDRVCGLHWEGNLRAITPHENHVKANKLIDDIV